MSQRRHQIKMRRIQLRYRWGWLVVGALILMSLSVQAHEVRPGYIDITETAPELFDIKWKQPVRAGQEGVRGLGLRPVFPTNCAPHGEARMVRRPGVLVERFELQCAGGLVGQVLGIEGLRRTITDVFVSLKPFEGEMITTRLTPEQPAITLGAANQSVWTYFSLGVEHLLLGIDHILFIIGLALVAHNFRRLFWVVTAFTLAHSITLALSVFELVRVPAAAIEVIIALSIIYVALDIGRGDDRSLLSRYPQLIAFLFGLVHGFGFAGVLAEIGLPRGDVALALALFNMGLEVGQLGVVCAMGAVAFVSIRLGAARYRASFYEATSIAMGGIATFWVLSRTATILS